jgi:hypothetical protein
MRAGDEGEPACIVPAAGTRGLRRVRNGRVAPHFPQLCDRFLWVNSFARRMIRRVAEAFEDRVQQLGGRCLQVRCSPSPP